MGKCIARVFKKNSVKPNAASHNTTSWYTDTDEFLEFSLSGDSLHCKGPALQKIILDFLGSPPCMWYPWIVPEGRVSLVSTTPAVKGQTPLTPLKEMILL